MAACDTCGVAKTTPRIPVPIVGRNVRRDVAVLVIPDFMFGGEFIRHAA
jgi:hypothetical protein